MRVLAATLALLAMVSVAGAAEQVWFTSPGASIQGAPGVTMVLPNAGSYAVSAWVGSADPSQLWAFEGGLMGPATASALTAYLPGPAGWTVDLSYAGPPQVGPPNPGMFFRVAESSLGSPWGPGTYKFADFTIDVSANTGLIGGVPWSAGNGWATGNGETPPVQFGAYWIASSGSDGAWANGPAIEVLPEPGSLLLLGLGLVGLLRRR